MSPRHPTPPLGVHAEIDDRIRALELHDAEIFGRDGDGGRFAALENTVKDHTLRIQEFGMFRARVLWLGAAALTIGGMVAALVFKAIDHYLKL